MQLEPKDTNEQTEFLRRCLGNAHVRIAELREEVKGLKTGYTWAIFGTVTGWGAVITICANFWG